MELPRFDPLTRTYQIVIMTSLTIQEELLNKLPNDVEVLHLRNEIDEENPNEMWYEITLKYPDDNTRINVEGPIFTSARIEVEDGREEYVM